MRQPGKKLFAERDRFGKWQHALGASHVLLAYVVDSPEHGLISRLELQTHLVDEVENDLCRPSEFPTRWERVQTRMAMQGVLPPEDPVYVRVDPAVDVVYEDPAEGRDVLEAVRYARWPYRVVRRVSRGAPVHDGRDQEQDKDRRSRLLPKHKAPQRESALGQAPL